MSLTLRAFNNDGEAAFLDLYEKESVLLQYNFQDLSSFEPDGNYTREFRIPDSPNNREFFGSIFDVNFDGWFDFRKKVNASLEIDTLPFMRGHIQVKQVVKKKMGYEYIVTFFGESANISRSIGERKLRDIAALPDLDYTLDFANIPDPNADTILTLCDKFNLAQATGDGFTGIQDPDSPLLIGHLTPAVRAKWLFDKIVNEAGFTWEGADFEDFLENIYVPFVSGQFLTTDQTVNDIFMSVGVSTDITGVTATTDIVQTEFADNGGYVSSGIFTAPYSGYYTFRVFSNMTKTAGGSGGTWRLFLVNTTTSQDSLVGSYMVWGTANSTITRSADRTVFLAQGDQLKMQLREIVSVGTYTIEGSATNDQATGTGFFLTGASAPMAASGVTVLMNQNAPDIKQIDFFKGLLTMANCILASSNALPNHYIIQPVVEYIGSGDSLDWTTKIDTTKDALIYPTTDLQYRNFHITYRADGDAFNKVFTDKGGRVFGEYKISVANLGEENINDFATQDKKIELAFSATPCNEVFNSPIPVPKFLNESSQFSLPSCRILYYAGDATCIMAATVGGTPTNKSVKVLSNYSVLNPDIGDLDLNFAPDTPLQNIFASPLNTLWFRYHAGFYSEIYSKGSRIMEAYFALDYMDILNFSFADEVWIENAWWRVVEIADYKAGTQEPCKVKLVKIINLGLDCDFIPASRAVDGVITFSDGTESGLAGNQFCCEKYGYTWNGTNCLA
jgi:hypothetical protein